MSILNQDMQVRSINTHLIHLFVGLVLIAAGIFGIRGTDPLSMRFRLYLIVPALVLFTLEYQNWKQRNS
ncbi:MAG: hypothetical protein ACXAE3_11320 [Candidatus Kariarchaeaceae archaeon]|jgi:hypothetical protein